MGVGQINEGGQVYQANTKVQTTETADQNEALPVADITTGGGVTVDETVTVSNPLGVGAVSTVDAVNQNEAVEGQGTGTGGPTDPLADPKKAQAVYQTLASDEGYAKIQAQINANFDKALVDKGLNITGPLDSGQTYLKTEIEKNRKMQLREVEAMHAYFKALDPLASIPIPTNDEYLTIKYKKSGYKELKAKYMPAEAVLDNYQDTNFAFRVTTPSGKARPDLAILVPGYVPGVYRNPITNAFFDPNQHVNKTSFSDANDLTSFTGKPEDYVPALVAQAVIKKAGPGGDTYGDTTIDADGDGNPDDVNNDGKPDEFPIRLVMYNTPEIRTAHQYYTVQTIAKMAEYNGTYDAILEVALPDEAAQIKQKRADDAADAVQKEKERQIAEQQKREEERAIKIQRQEKWKADHPIAPTLPPHQVRAELPAVKLEIAKIPVTLEDLQKQQAETRVRVLERAEYNDAVEQAETKATKQAEKLEVAKDYQRYVELDKAGNRTDFEGLEQAQHPVSPLYDNTVAPVGGIRFGGGIGFEPMQPEDIDLRFASVTSFAAGKLVFNSEGIPIGAVGIRGNQGFVLNKGIKTYTDAHATAQAFLSTKNGAPQQSVMFDANMTTPRYNYFPGKFVGTASYTIGGNGWFQATALGGIEQNLVIGGNKTPKEITRGPEPFFGGSFAFQPDGPDKDGAMTFQVGSAYYPNTKTFAGGVAIDYTKLTKNGNRVQVYARATAREGYPLSPNPPDRPDLNVANTSVTAGLVVSIPEDRKNSNKNQLAKIKKDNNTRKDNGLPYYESNGRINLNINVPEPGSKNAREDK